MRTPFQSFSFSDATVPFSRSLDLILFNKRYEQLLGGYGSNFFIAKYNRYPTLFSTVFNSTCLCGTMFTCTEQILLNVNGTFVPMPGWYTGCYMIDSLLYSTRESYYDKMYIDFIYASLPTFDQYAGQWNISTPHPQPLDVDRAGSSRFPINATVRSILDGLFVESWHEEIDFQGCCQGCQPTQCSYSEDTRKALVPIVTTIIGLVGGLSTVLNIAIPNIVKFMRGPGRQFFHNYRRRFTQRGTTVSPVAIISH